MSETLVQILPMLVLGGLLAGWMAEAVSWTGGYGLIPDMLAGLVGSLVVGAGVWLFVPDAGMVTMFLTGSAGAALTIMAQRRLWRSVRLAS